MSSNIYLHSAELSEGRTHDCKIQVDRLIKIGVLQKINTFQWSASPFIIPKKNGTAWSFISDFRELNKRMKKKPFQFLKSQIFVI